jgi:hypothetical protein
VPASARSEQPLAIDVRGMRRIYNVMQLPLVAIDGVDI